MDEQLKQLLDYTKFHIGMYTTLGTLIVGALSFGGENTLPQHSAWLLAPLVFLVIAGMAGGMVGSSIPDHISYATFLRARLGPWRQKWLEAGTWIHIEHTAFWIAVLLAIWVAIIVQR